MIGTVVYVCWLGWLKVLVTLVDWLTVVATGNWSIDCAGFRYLWAGRYNWSIDCAGFRYLWAGRYWDGGDSGLLIECGGDCLTDWLVAGVSYLWAGRYQDGGDSGWLIDCGWLLTDWLIVQGSVIFELDNTEMKVRRVLIDWLIVQGSVICELNDTEIEAALVDWLIVQGSVICELDDTEMKVKRVLANSTNRHAVAYNEDTETIRW